jgi:hypothetical protein
LPWCSQGRIRGSASRHPHPEAEDGLLTADDILRIDLNDTELVVLSAYETGIGQIRTLEGALGMRKDFEVAGAQALVISLWTVPGDTTKEMFETFCTNSIDRKMRPAEALRGASDHPFSLLRRILTRVSERFLLILPDRGRIAFSHGLRSGRAIKPRTLGEADLNSRPPWARICLVPFRGCPLVVTIDIQEVTNGACLFLGSGRTAFA